MKTLGHIIAILLAVTLFGGCAMPGSVVPGSTAAEELLKRLGSPTDKRNNPQGGEFWEYAYGPEGTETWLFGVDKGGMVRSSTQLLTEERLQQIVPGETTEADVRTLLGRPREISRLRGETVWEWRVNIGLDPGTYVVRFDDNRRVLGYNVLRDFLSDQDQDSVP